MPRYIDADDVFRWYVETFSEKNNGERAIQPNEIRFSMNDIRDNLDNIPTIDAEPVRHGKWEVIFYDNIPKIAQCSECGEGLIFTKKDYPIRHISNYCPNCGAKMEVDDERYD